MPECGDLVKGISQKLPEQYEMQGQTNMQTESKFRGVRAKSCSDKWAVRFNCLLAFELIDKEEYQARRDSCLSLRDN
jgi:hypothetical protein